MMKLKFLGAAGTVTGSRYLVEAGERHVLVDCGLFQGLKELRLRNWDPLPIDPADIDAVVLTHAHLDHTGYLPRLVAEGFRGRIFCTPGTADLCRIVLPDAARIQVEDAREANRGGYSKHSPALPLYDEAAAFRALAQLQPVGFERPVTVVPSVSVEFINAGHLLGSAFVRMTIDGSRPRVVLFSGDVGRYDRPVLPDPSPVTDANVLVVESTYGDRLHEADDRGARLAAIIRDTVARGGKLIVPAFALGRAAEMIYWLRKLEEAAQIPRLPVYLDSPMAIEALQDYSNRADELDPDMRSRPGEAPRLSTARFKTVSSPRESDELVRSRIPSIVISASGMATGGRVLNHLMATLPDKRNTVVFAGYQAAGTRGRLLVEGAKDVKIRGRLVPVAARIEHIDSMSAHADSAEMLRWLGGFTKPPEIAYVVHGEPPAAEAFAAKIQQRLGWRVHVPAYLEEVDLLG
jgi:metallo-beta-lactamase family protein